MNERLVNACGWLGIIALFSCASSVIFSPLAYPGYNWLAQAVSDLSATDAPSLQRWNILAAPYEIFTIVCLMMVCVAIQGKLTRPIRLGIYLFTLMNWVSNLGYKMFPLTSSGNAGTLQDIIHIYGITLAVVFLSIISLGMIAYFGLRFNNHRGLGMWAGLCLGFMFLGAIGVALVPPAYFGIPERFSVFSAVTFVAVLGAYLTKGFRNSRVI